MIRGSVIPITVNWRTIPLFTTCKYIQVTTGVRCILWQTIRPPTNVRPTLVWRRSVNIGDYRPKMTDRVRLRLPDRHRHWGQPPIDQCRPLSRDNSGRGTGSDNNLPRMIITGLIMRSRVLPWDYIDIKVELLFLQCKELLRRPDLLRSEYDGMWISWRCTRSFLLHMMMETVVDS